MDVGFQRAGFSTLWANEWNKAAASTFRLNHPSVEMVCADIETVLEDIPSADITCVFGGPPCQGFSVAGKMDPDDPRSRHVFNFLEVVRRVRPLCFVMENVRALAKLEKFSGVRRALISKARDLGYRPELVLLNSRDFGVPQSRERVFIIAFRNDLDRVFSADALDAYRLPERSSGEVLRHFGPAGTDRNPLTCKAKITLAEKPVLRRSPYSGMLFNGLGRPVNPDAASCTLPASMGGNKTPVVDERHVYDGASPWIVEYHSHLMNGGPPFGMHDTPRHLRRLTTAEAAALQSFPSDYKFAGPVSSHYTQIGNAVPCELAFAVASAVRDVLSEHSFAGNKLRLAG